MAACRAVVRELGGYDLCAAALSHIWVSEGRSVSPAVLRSTLAIENERNYFRGEWLIWFAGQSDKVATLLGEIAGHGRPKKSRDDFARDLIAILFKVFPQHAAQLIRKAESI